MNLIKRLKMYASKNNLGVGDIFLGSLFFMLLIPSCTPTKSTNTTSDPCKNVTCSNKGECSVSKSNKPVCTCETGYKASGTDCVEDTNNTDLCNGVTCSGQGTCVVSNGIATCNCNQGYVPNGTTCIVSTSICAQKNCNSPYGSCTVVDNVAKCQCQIGYDVNKDCGACAQGYAGTPPNCVADPLCAQKNCNYGSCAVENGVAVCKCNPGFITSTSGDCNSCAASATGTYPNCTPDPQCTTNNCNGHGTCVNNTCQGHCNIGYTGIKCEMCAEGYTGYPNCCQCTAGEVKCKDATTKQVCTNGCSWASDSCDTLCKQGGYAKMVVCSYSAENKKDQCFCAKSTNNSGMFFKVIDICINGQKPNFAIYEIRNGVAVALTTTFTFSAEGVVNSVNVECTIGNKVCIGGWLNTLYWYCNKGCSLPNRAGSCYTCGTTIFTPEIPFNC